MDIPEKNNADLALLEDWYRFAAEQSWAVDSYLRLIRVRECKTQEQQRHEFGVGPQEFLKLRGMPLPRADIFASDAQRIAQECHLQHPLAFVQTLLLAKQLALSVSSTGHYYEAAFDAGDDLDEPHDPEKG